MYDALAIKLKKNCARIRRIIQRAEITAQRVCIHTAKYMMAYAMVSLHHVSCSDTANNDANSSFISNLSRLLSFSLVVFALYN